MKIDNAQFQSFFQHLDCEVKFKSKNFCSTLQNPYFRILLDWQIISTAGLLDALCDHISTKQGAKSCGLIVPIVVDPRHSEALYYGLRQVAVSLGTISSLEYLELHRFQVEYKINNVLHRWCCAADGYCNAFPIDYQKRPTEIDYRWEAIVLQHVDQITEFYCWPDVVHENRPDSSHHVEEFTEALRNHPSLTSLTFYSGLDQTAIHRALLSMPKLQKVSTKFDSLAADTVGDLVTKDSLRQLSITGYNVITPKEWTALCRALGRPTAKLTSLILFYAAFPSREFGAALSRALLTNASLETLGLIPWHRFTGHCCDILAPHGAAAALARALASHPRLGELQLEAPYDLSPEKSGAWQDLFCHGIAQMKHLRRLALERFPRWTAAMVQALRQLVPFLSELTIERVNTTKEWTELVSAVIYGRRLTTLSIILNPFEALQFREGKQRYTKLMEGVLAMNHAGRAYVLKNEMNKRQAIVVLDSVKDNLDCLYIHLRESHLF